jgi:hypothetical protein
MEYTSLVTRCAADSISQLLLSSIPVASVLDVGCAQGVWLSAWASAGVAEIFGIDGNYVAKESLKIPARCFESADLSRQWNLSRRFDLVQSLEVAEHLPENAADQFIENLATHSKGVILFSAAPPGQGGEFHVNERPYEYWREKFQAFGFEPYDYIRPLIHADTTIPFWYRHNTILYVHRDRMATLPESIRLTRVPVGSRIREFAPGWFRLRRQLVRSLPFSVQQLLARAKARWLPR